jgi:hypothetical protein
MTMIERERDDDDDDDDDVDDDDMGVLKKRQQKFFLSFLSQNKLMELQTEEVLKHRNDHTTNT